MWSKFVWDSVLHVIGLVLWSMKWKIFKMIKWLCFFFSKLWSHLILFVFDLPPSTNRLLLFFLGRSKAMITMLSCYQSLIRHSIFPVGFLSFFHYQPMGSFDFLLWKFGDKRRHTDPLSQESWHDRPGMFLSFPIGSSRPSNGIC